jgi:hypothetical protein
MAINGNGGLVGLGKSLITALPPVFIVLILLNAGFIAFVMWFLDDQLNQRDRMAQQLFDRCMAVMLGKEGP